jgi:hypothetical protein
LLPCRTSIWTRLFNLVCGKVCLEEVTIMRKLIFIGIVAVGALVGLLSAAHDDWATRMVMSAVGALFAAPIGAVLTRRPKPKVVAPAWDESLEAGAITSPKALAANYWRDKGHPPFMKPQEAEPDKHMFDPDKLG